MSDRIDYDPLGTAAAKEAAKTITVGSRYPADPTDDPRESFVWGADFGAEWASKQPPTQEQLEAAGRALHAHTRRGSKDVEQRERSWKAFGALYIEQARLVLEAASQHSPYSSS